jgi:putative MATE family efflux protein
MIVGQALGPEAVTGINITGSLSFLVLGFSQGCSGGFGILLSQFVGAKNEEKIKKSFATSIVLTIIIALILSIVSVVFSREILKALKTNELYMEYAHSYIRAIFSGIFFSMFYNLVSQVMLAFGDGQTPLYILIISAVLNLLLNSLLFIFDLGVAWAGWATVIAQGVSAVIGLIIIFKRLPILRLKKSDFRFTLKFALKHLAIGLPMAFQFSITAIGCMIQQRAFNLFPPQYSMAQGTGSKISGLIDSGVLKAFGVAMATYCGQNYGAKRLDRIRAGMKSAVIVGGGIMLSSMALVITLSYPIANALLPSADQEVYDLIFKYVLIHASMYFFLALIYTFRESLQGMGKSMTATIGGVIELLARVVCSFTLARISFDWACLSNPTAWL